MNPYKALMDLLPQRPLKVGEVLDVTDGVATIEEAGGFQSQARGDVTVGQRVYFRDGVVEGTAPDLPLEVVEE